jgi:hypothetical protein
MLKASGGSTWSAIVVATAPYAISALLCFLFAIGFLAAVGRYLCSNSDGQDAMERLIRLSANAVVSILTLAPVIVPDRPSSSSAPRDEEMVRNAKP